jgi:shikimate kinase
MSNPVRVFIIGHPGAGKALLAKTLAQKLGWRFVDADFGLEVHIGRQVESILGAQGHHAFNECQFEVLTALCAQEKVVVTTDASVVCSEKNRQLLLNEFTVFLKVSIPTQIERMLRNDAPLLLAENEMEHLLEQLHEARDGLLQEVAALTIQGDAPTLEQHVDSIINSLAELPLKKSNVLLDKKDLVLFHKEQHTPVHLSKQQALYLRGLAQGKSAKEIAIEAQVSYRTVEGVLAIMMERLGCSSSKELISLYHEL